MYESEAATQPMNLKIEAILGVESSSKQEFLKAVRDNRQ